MHPEISRKEERLGHLFQQASDLQKNDDIDDELKAQFVWYLCIRTSGYLESSVKSILLEYVESQTESRQVVDFAENRLRRARALDRGEILGLVKQFSTVWRRRLGKLINPDLRVSLDNLLTNRNEIAHGGDAPNLSLIDLENYYEDVKKVVKFVYDECYPQEGDSN